MLFSQSPHFSVLFLVYTEIFHLSCNPYWISFPQWDVLKDFEMRILAMSFKRLWTEVASFFIPFSNLLSRQDHKVWKYFTCVHVAFTHPATSQPQSVPCQITSFKLLTVLEGLNEQEQSAWCHRTKSSIYPDTVSNISSVHPNFYLLDTVLAHGSLNPR